MLDHQRQLTERFIAQPWRSAGNARYAIPVPQEAFMRCWGRGSNQADRGLQFERSDCEMDSRIYVNGALLTGYFTVRHEAYDGSKLGALRFADRYSASFRNEFMGRNDARMTAAQCVERQVAGPAAAPGSKEPAGTGRAPAGAGLPLKAVICLRAYKKLEGLFDLSVLVATLDSATVGAQGRLDAHGVSATSAERLARHYLDGYAWTAPKNASR